MANPIVAEQTSKLGQIKARMPRRKSLPDGRASRSQAGPVRIDTPSQPTQPIPPELVIRQIADVRRHLEMCVENLKGIEAANASPPSSGSSEAVTGVSPVTVQMIAACLSELLKVEWAQPHRKYCPDLCKLLDCPQQPVLRHAVCHTIEVLEKTKWRFKSKELKALREGLQAFLANSDHFYVTPDNMG